MGMALHWSPRSPFVRKVMITLHEVGLAGQVALRRGPVVYCLESADLPAGVLLEQAAIRRGVEVRPVPAEIAGMPLVALETELVVLPASGDALYDEVPADAVGTASARFIPYFAWGNRGAGEMSVWLPVVW